MNGRASVLGRQRQIMPPIVMGDISLNADLDHNHRQLHRKLLEKALQANREMIQTAFAKSAWLLAREVHEVRIRNRQNPRHVAKIESLPKFGLGNIDRIQIVHVNSIRIGSRIPSLGVQESSD